MNAQGEASDFVEKHPLYLQLGNKLEVRLKAYRKLFNDFFNEDVLHEIMQSLNHELVLGRSYFKDVIEEITNRQTRRGKLGRPKVEDVRGVYLVGY